MNSVAKRKQLVNQLRKAHFPFGFQNKTQKSQYISKYPGYQISTNQSIDNGKKNNFTIGNQNDQNNYQSEFKQKYPEHHLNSRQQAIGAKNAGQNNIVFGYDNSNDVDQYNTNYKDQYNKKNAPISASQPIDKRKKNIDFGDSLTDFTTTYNKVYDKKNPIQNVPLVDKAEIRKSNLMLGNDQVNFQTQNSMAYRNAGTINYHAHKPQQSANIDLGQDSVNYASQNKQRFNYKDAKRQVVEKEMIRDFRSAHFHFGFPQGQNNVESQSHAQYGQKPLQVVQIQGSRPNNINLNVDGKNYFESSYGKEFTNWGTLPKAEINRHGRNDNILIGTDVDPAQRYVSEAKSNFIKKQISKVNPMKTQGSLQLGEQTGDYRTHYELTHDNKFPNRQNSKLSQEQINRMKAINIVTGFQDGSYNLHSSEYGKKLGERGTLSKETLDKMKNTNIVLQTVPNVNELNGKTSYKTSYFYKQNNEF